MRKALVNAAGWLAPVLVALVATPWLLHTLGAARFGVWAMCVLLAALLPTLDLGYGIAAVRDIARRREPGQRIELSAELLSIALLAGLCFSVLLLMGADLIPHWLNFDEAISHTEARVLVLLLAPWVALGCINGALTALPRGLERFGTLSLVGIASSLALWVGAIVLAQRGATLPMLAAYAIALQIVVAGVLVIVHRAVGGRWPLPALRLQQLTRSSGFAAASFTNSLTSLATYHADKALVSAFVGPAAAGLYVAVSNVANKLLGLIAALAAVVYPRVAALQGGGDSRAAAGIYFVASRMALNVTLALATVGMVLADRFLHLWLGSVVTPQLVAAFRLQIVAYTICSSAVVASNVLSGSGNARRGAAFAAFGGVATVAGGLLLIPRWGVVGAAFAGLIGMAQAAVFDVWLERELRAAHPEVTVTRRPWLGWALAASVAGGAAWAIAHAIEGWLGLMLAGGVGLALWAVVWFAGGFALPVERELLRRVLRPVPPPSR